MMLRKTLLTVACVLFSASVHADDINSTIRGSDSVPAGSLSSTVRGPGEITAGAPNTTIRTKNYHPDPSLSTTMTDPHVDPMLNTSVPTPADAAATSTTNMKSSDPMLNTSAPTPKSAAATSTVPPAVDPSLCRALTKYTPSADLAYQPGVDSSGRAVVPADVPGSPQIKLPSKIDIPLTISLAKTLNLDTSKYPYNTLGTGTEATLGVISVEGDKVTFNGQPLSDTQQDNLSVLCLKQSK